MESGGDFLLRSFVPAELRRETIAILNENQKTNSRADSIQHSIERLVRSGWKVANADRLGGEMAPALHHVLGRRPLPRLPFSIRILDMRDHCF